MKDNARKNAADKQPKREPLPNKPRDPLTEDVEDALIDQDIPVETGVRPEGSKQRH